MWTLLLWMASALAGPPTVGALEDQVTGAVFLEGAGAGWLYSVNGQVLFPVSAGGLGLRAGGSYFAFPGWGATHHDLTFPVALSFRAGHASWAPEGGVGVTSFIVDGDYVHALLTPMIGVDHRAPGGLLLGAHVQLNVPLVAGTDTKSLGSQGPFPWGGVRVGYWFGRKD